jgi:DNA-directed RNA polymerase specialized sigma24 family protein
LASLPDRQREVLLLIFGLAGHDKLSVQEIAWKLRENGNWVLCTARQALRRLREEFGRQLEGYLEIAA